MSSGGVDVNQTISGIFATRQFETHTTWRWWTSMVVGIGIYLATTAVIVVVVVVAILGTVSPEQIESGEIPALPSGVTVAASLLSQALSLILVLVFTRKGGARWIDRLHLQSYLPSTSHLIAFAGTAAAVIAMSFLWSNLFPEADAVDSSWAKDILADSHVRPAALALILLAAPLSEELLFRGFMLPPLTRTRLGFSGAAIVTSLIWSAVHFYSLPGSAVIFLLGLALSYMLWRTGSLWPGIFLHVILNGVFAATVLLA